MIGGAKVSTAQKQTQQTVRHFLDQFPGIQLTELVSLFTASWRAYLEIWSEHEHAASLLQSEPLNDSYRIYEYMAREEVDVAEQRMNRFLRALRSAPIESDDDLIAIVTFEAFTGSLAPKNPGFVKMLRRKLSERFGADSLDAEQPNSDDQTGMRRESGTSRDLIWGPEVTKKHG